MQPSSRLRHKLTFTLKPQPQAAIAMIETPRRTEWAALKRRLQEKYPDLTDADLLPPSDNPEELVWHIQRRLGTDIEEAQTIFDEANQCDGPCPSQ